MEVVKVVPEDLCDKFRSKRDLYMMLTRDLHYFLPPFHKCPLHFLRKALEGKKKMIKQKDITTIEVPRYEELAVAKIWPLIKEADDLFQYFPDYLSKQVPDRDHMFSILCTLRFSTMEKMIADARKNRALESNENENQFVYIEKDLFNEISNVLSQKTTKGKSTYLLKRSSKLVRKYKPRKKYPIGYSRLSSKEETKEKNDEDRME